MRLLDNLEVTFMWIAKKCLDTIKMDLKYKISTLKQKLLRQFRVEKINS